MPAARPSPALDRFRALAGEWAGSGGDMGDFTATYRVTGGGSAVVETLFPGTDHEMVTVYHVDGDDLVLTHYCALGNQPRMRAKAAAATGNVVAFEYDGGANIDPARDQHMHRASFEFVSADELRSEWELWEQGTAQPASKFHFVRKK